MEQHLSQLETIIKNTGETLEGNCFYIHQTFLRPDILQYKRRNYEMLIKLLESRQIRPAICEIGVNAAHSLLVMLETSLFGADFTLFDLGEHAYTKPCLEYIQSQYPSSTFQTIWGDSTKTIPEWISKHSHVRDSFDLVHVDGGHTMECITSDFATAVQLTKPGGYIIIDDVHDHNIVRVCDEWMRGKVVEPIQQYCSLIYPHILFQKTKGSS
jgi:predicted O-methyltransferase YrrM